MRSLTIQARNAGQILAISGVALLIREWILQKFPSDHQFPLLLRLHTHGEFLTMSMQVHAQAQCQDPWADICRLLASGQVMCKDSSRLHPIMKAQKEEDEEGEVQGDSSLSKEEKALKKSEKKAKEKAVSEEKRRLQEEQSLADDKSSMKHCTILSYQDFILPLIWAIKPFVGPRQYMTTFSGVQKADAICMKLLWAIEAIGMNPDDEHLITDQSFHSETWPSRFQYDSDLGSTRDASVFGYSIDKTKTGAFVVCRPRLELLAHIGVESHPSLQRSIWRKRGKGEVKDKNCWFYHIPQPDQTIIIDVTLLDTFLACGLAFPTQKMTSFISTDGGEGCYRNFQSAW